VCRLVSFSLYEASRDERYFEKYFYCKVMEKNVSYSFLKCCVKMLLFLRHQSDLIVQALSTEELSLIVLNC
jgi:hypothetical protein